MATKITILSKSEAFPIGDVLAFVVTWKEKKTSLGECYYTTGKDQIKPFTRRYRIDRKNEQLLDLKRILTSEVKNYHKNSAVMPAEEKYMAAQKFDGFNPYAEDRFKWNVSDSKDIYMFLEYFGEFLTFIEKNTACQDLRSLIEFYKDLKEKIAVG